MNRKTIYQLLLDESGSMKPRTVEVIEGFNEQMSTLKKELKESAEQELVVFLSKFNREVTHHYINEPIEEIPVLSEEMYCPAGSTALLDAIGESIKQIQVTYGSCIDQDEASVVFVIFTDGMENSSQHYSYEVIKGLITELEETDKWLFSFVGSDLNGIKYASALNIKQSNLMKFYNKDSKDTITGLTKSLSYYMHRKGSESKIPKDFFDQE